MTSAKKLWTALILCSCLLSCGGGSTAAKLPATQTPAATAPTIPTAPAVEYRALWVDTLHGGIRTDAEVDKLIADAQRAKVNALIVQVVRKGEAWFNNSPLPRTSDPAVAPAPYDPLQTLITKAHAASPPLEVHAWLNVFNVGTTSALWLLHAGDWGSSDNLGNQNGFLDPGHPDATAFLQTVFLHLIRNYAVDGIHLDYIRYYDGGTWGYNARSVADFNLSRGTTGNPAPTDPAFQQWRRDRVTNFVRNLYQAVAAEKPKLKVSAALIAYGAGPRSDAEWFATPTYSEVFQDWRLWLRDGILDFGAVMNYDREWNASQLDWFNRWIDFEKDNQGSRMLLAGVAAYLNYPEMTFAQIQRTRTASAAGKSLAGVAIYSYASTNPYSTDDFYTNQTLAATLPRQPYTSSWDAALLRARADQFNSFFYNALSNSSTYADPALGNINTVPPFPTPSTIPPMPWKP